MFPPRCSHGRIILGCADPDCEEQNAFLADQAARMDVWLVMQREQARKVIEAYYEPR